MKAIRGRLQRLKDEVTETGTAEEFGQLLGVSRATVSSWLAKDAKTKTPGTPHVLTIAEELDIQPTWLLLGEGPEKLGAPMPSRGLAEQLHAYVLGVLAHEFKANPRFVGGVLPGADDLLREVMARYRDLVGEKVELARKINRSDAAADKLLTSAGVELPEQGTIKRALLDHMMSKRREIRALGPVEPETWAGIPGIRLRQTVD